MTILLASLYLALGVLIVAVEIQRTRVRRPFNALSLFSGAYFLFFVFVPLNVLVLGEAAVRQKYAYQTWSHGDIWTALALMLSYVVFVLGYHRRGKNEPGVGVGVGPHAIRTVLWLIGGFFLLGIMALAYHVGLMGGVIETLQFAPGSRTGEFRLEGQALFVRQFAYFLATAFMLGWAIYVDTDTTGRAQPPWRHLMLVLLGLVFVYFALSTYGRREFLYPMIICLMIWALAGQRRLWGGLGWLLALSALWFVVYSVMIPATVQPATVQPATDFLWDAYLRTIQGLGDSFMHFVAAEHAALWQFGFLSDLWEMPAQFLPSQVLGFERSRGLLGETSEFILGRPLEPGLSGEEPLGLHGYLLVNFSYLGMFLFFYLGGMGYRVLDAALRPAKGGSAISWLIFMWAIVGALEFLREGVLILVLKPRFSWWLAIGILLWFGYRRAARPPTFQQLSRQTTHP